MNSKRIFSDDSGTQPLDMEAFLTSPSGKSDPCEVRDMPGQIYDLAFVPEEEGLHHVSIKYKGIHISGQFVISNTLIASGGSRTKYCVWEASTAKRNYYRTN